MTTGISEVRAQLDHNHDHQFNIEEKIFITNNTKKILLLRTESDTF